MDYILHAPIASLIFAITIITTIYAFSNSEVLSKLILHPYSVYRKERVYTIFTSGLIHNDWMHLFFNMASFYFFAFSFNGSKGLEENIGHWQFAVLYILSLGLSDITTIYKRRNNYNYYSLGASGAVSAVIFGAIMYDPWGTMIIMPIPFPMWKFVFGALYLVYCHFAAKYARNNVNHDAHLLGAVCGVVITCALHPSILPEFIQQITWGAQSHFHL